MFGRVGLRLGAGHYYKYNRRLQIIVVFLDLAVPVSPREGTPTTLSQEFILKLRGYGLAGFGTFLF